MRKSIAIATLSLTAGAITGAAQTRGDVEAAVALMLTPVGALPPLMTSTIEGETQRGVALGLRYGHWSSSNFFDSNNGGVTAILPVGVASTVSLTAGFFSPDCRDCSSGLMLGLGGDTH